MKKKILSLVLVLVLALTAVIGGTLAYFTDNDEAVNTFTLGDIDIDLEEPEWKEDAKDVVPGVAYAKDPYVKNIGDNDAWIRIDVTLSDAAAFTAAATNHGITELETIFTIANDFDSKWVRAGISSDTTADTLTYSYYYLTKVAPNGETDRLFTAVTIPAAFNNAEMAAIGDNFTITVTAHAIQDADGFDTVQEAFADYVFEANTPVQP